MTRAMEEEEAKELDIMRRNVTRAMDAQKARIKRDYRRAVRGPSRGKSNLADFHGPA